MWQLHAQDARLELVEARVVAHELEGPLVVRAVEAQRAHLLGERGVAGGDRAAVAERAEVLRREERERRDVPSAPGRRPSASTVPAACAASSITGHAERLDLGHRRDVAEQVDGDHGLGARGQHGAHGLGRDQDVSGSTSQNTGRAPVGGIASADA